MIIGTEMYESADEQDFKKKDVWLLGVLLYWLITKELSSDDYALIEQRIKTSSLVSKGPIWDKCSDAGKDLILKMLTLDKRKRPTIKECLNHVWFKEQIVSDSQNNQLSLDPTRDFKVKKRLQTHALLYLARTFNLSNVSNTFI